MKYDMKVVGLTGGIATGKSTVSKIISDLGLALVDADVLAREVVSPGSFGLKALVEVFGSEILNKSAQKYELDRPKLAQKLFSDPASRLVVENILHPLIQWRAKEEFAVLKRQGQKIAFYDAALIFEKSLQGNFDSVIVVHTGQELEAAKKIQMERLIGRDKLSIEKARERVSSQMPMADKIKGAHHLIDNSADLKRTELQVKELIQRLTRP